MPKKDTREFPIIRLIKMNARELETNKNYPKLNRVTKTKKKVRKLPERKE